MIIPAAKMIDAVGGVDNLLLRRAKTRTMVASTAANAARDVEFVIRLAISSALSPILPSQFARRLDRVEMLQIGTHFFREWMVWPQSVLGYLQSPPKLLLSFRILTLIL